MLCIMPTAQHHHSPRILPLCPLFLRSPLAFAVPDMRPVPFSKDGPAELAEKAFRM